MIAVVDYGVGNLGSILNMLRKVGADAKLVSDPEEVSKCHKLVLPGVGAFDNGMCKLADANLVGPVKAAVNEGGAWLLGICLGMQMLASESEEGREHGLGFLDARCERFRFKNEPSLKIPHMGWNLIDPEQEAPILAGLNGDSRFYFVHSYYLICQNPQDVLARTSYGVHFPSIVQRGRVIGAQFHPEKSHRFGMRFFQNFVAL